MVSSQTLRGVSLFSGAGLGDLGFRAAGVHFLAMVEIDEKRAGIARRNFPESDVVSADISESWQEICEKVERNLAGKPLDLIACTPPCQGMSKSGQGTLLRNIREGKRPRMDPRNRLILPGLEVIDRLKPKWVVFENVTEMLNTVIEDEHGDIVPVLDAVEKRLCPEYQGRAYKVEFADYGVPQRRQRLITVLSRDPAAIEILESGGGFVPAPTHSERPSPGKKAWVSVSSALQDFPLLDASSKERATDPKVEYHRVPVLDSRKYGWVANTAPGESAFDNQCINPDCGFDGNQTHGSAKVEGINRTRRDTPIHCEKCGEKLPRPTTIDKDGNERLMSGYTSAYKRMRADRPAPAITRNVSYPCSDHKVHPTENRVLSLAEAFVIQTVADYGVEWAIENEEGDVKVASDTLIRLVLGESVPPRFLELLMVHILDVAYGQSPESADGLPIGSAEREAEARGQSQDQLSLYDAHEAAAA